MSASAPIAVHESTATIPARIGIVPSANMKKPPGGCKRNVSYSYPFPIFSSPLPSPHHCGLAPDRTRGVCTTCSFKPPLPPCRPSPWMPHISAGRSACWGACTLGPEIWPIIPLSILSCPQEPWHLMGLAGSLPAMRIGWFQCERCLASSVGSSKRHSPRRLSSVTCPPASGNSHG